MRTSMRAIIFIAGSAVAFPAIAQQQPAPSEQSQKMQAGDADKSMKGGADENMQREADKGAKTKNSGESGFVADQEKPGTSASPPGRPMETTGSNEKRQ
jgi:hypothetical protein